VPVVVVGVPVVVVGVPVVVTGALMTLEFWIWVMLVVV
jgi:hypothetical protein